MHGAPQAGRERRIGWDRKAGVDTPIRAASNVSEELSDPVAVGVGQAY